MKGNSIIDYEPIFDEIKRDWISKGSTDKPALRQRLNDRAYAFHCDVDYEVLKGHITEDEGEELNEKITDYCISLHE